MSENNPGQNPNPTPPFYKTALGIWLIGAGGLFVLLGLGWAILWSAACGVVRLFRWNIIAGAVAAAAAVAAFIAPPMLDERVWAQQLDATRAMEIDGDPIDLTGKSVLFVGGSTYAPLMCSLLCQNIALYGPAEAVYFGHDRSLDLDWTYAPLDLTDRVIHRFPDGMQGPTPVRDGSVPATPDKIDYVVVEGGTTRDERERLSAELSKPLFRLTARYQVRIFAVDGGRDFDPTTQDPVFSQLELSRYGLTFPYLPGLQGGQLKRMDNFRGRGAYVDSAHRDAALILCGPSNRPDYDACTDLGQIR